MEGKKRKEKKKSRKQSRYWISRCGRVLSNGGKRICVELRNSLIAKLLVTNKYLIVLVFLCVIWCSDFVVLIFLFFLTEKEQQEAIEHIDEVQNEIDR